MLRRELDRLVDRVFPGMGIRPVYLTSIATLMMCVYWYWSRKSRVPDWFFDTMTGVTGLDDPQFHATAWRHLMCLILLAIVPTVFTVITDRSTLSGLGLGIKQSGREFLLVAGLFVLFVPVLYYISTFPGFQRQYPRIRSASAHVEIFVLFHLLYLIKWAAWEYFFRGWMLFSFQKDFGVRAVLISTIPFTLMHYGKPELETYSALLAGFILCWLALRARSIWPGVAIHAAVSTTLELFAADWFLDVFR